MDQIKDFAEQLSSQMGIKTLESCEDYDKQYTGIELSDLEKSIALYRGRQEKFFFLEDQKKIQKRLAYEAEMARPFTAPELLQYVGHRLYNEFGFSKNEGKDGKPVYLYDDTNSEIIEALSLYFTGDPSFETCRLGLENNWKLKKGLMVMGTTGLGKTLLMRMFSSNKRLSYVVVSCRTVADYYAKDGADAIEFYSGPREEPIGDWRIFGQRQIGYCFDDLGTEDIRNNFGNKIDVLANILLNRYDKSIEMPWNFTHITTNLSGEEIEKEYGSRVRSRLREMFNQVVLKGKDRR